MNIAELMRNQAQTRPAAAAIIERRRGRDQVTSFAELDHRANLAAAHLHQRGLRPGDPVLIFQPMSSELYVALLAVFRLGAVAMFLDPSAGRSHIEQCCAIQPPRALIATPKAHLLRLASAALRHIPLKFSTTGFVPCTCRLEQTHGTNTADPGISSCAPEAPALLTFTSGSTGRPKAAMRSHGFLCTQHRVLEAQLGLECGKIDLTTMPIFLLANLASGVTSIIPAGDLRRPGFVDPSPILDQIARHQPHSVCASPAFIECIATAARQRKAPLVSLRKVFTGGAPVFPKLLTLAAEAAPQAAVIAVYGSTEAEPMAEIDRSEIRDEDHQAMLSGSGLIAGRPVPQIELRILRHQWGQPVGPTTREAFEAECLAPGAAGEIVVSGDHVLHGYMNGEGDAETKFDVDGRRWHRTGDSGVIDEQGRLWLLGRCSARIEIGTRMLYPFAVETAVVHHQNVRRAALVNHRGRIMLLLEREDSARELNVEILHQSLQWAGIDDYRVLPKIPVDRRHNAKVDYVALTRLLDTHDRAV